MVNARTIQQGRTVLNFTELPIDGQDFELLVRELLAQLNLRVFWSGKGSDGGRDLLADETQLSVFAASTKRWLIQCKHNAHASTAVGIRDLDDVVDSCTHHQATGYVLMCSTYPSSAVVQRLEGITANTSNVVTATFWDAVTIERMLSTPSTWPIAQRFFPKSANADGWRLHATENPHHWVVNYRGYYFHLSNRIGSFSQPHLSSIREHVADIEKIKLPKRHMLRLRAVYFDDKNGHYTWFVDYLYPREQEPRYTAQDLENRLGSDYVLGDGYFYRFDVMLHEYDPYSDHHDIDHYDFYARYWGNFLTGFSRRDYRS